LKDPEPPRKSPNLSPKPIPKVRAADGALITADFALEEGREVFTVPGEITSTLSAGTNALLRLGATPLTSPGDVLESLGIAPAALKHSVSHPLLELLPAAALFTPWPLVAGRHPSGQFTVAVRRLRMALSNREGGRIATFPSTTPMPLSRLESHSHAQGFTEFEQSDGSPKVRLPPARVRPS
jgi:predicted Rossmann fold nucleotide-binding protein DprA/Smf involved in DNA uptake